MKKLLSLFLTIMLLGGCAATYDGPTVTKSVLTAEESYDYHSDGTVSHQTRREYTYDIHGNQSQILEYSQEEDLRDAEPHLKTVLRYDEKGNLTRQTQYDVSGWFPRKLADTRYERDDQGRLTATRHSRDLRGNDTTVVYDDAAKTRTTTGSGSTIVEYLDENGWVIRAESVFDDGVPVTEEFDRRPDGQVRTVRTYRDGVLRSTMEHTYDDQGRPLTQTEIRDGETRVLFRYEYGESHVACTYADGGWSVTDYNPDGTRDDRVVYDAEGNLRELVIYRYTEIQVPNEEGGTP